MTDAIRAARNSALEAATQEAKELELAALSAYQAPENDRAMLLVLAQEAEISTFFCPTCGHAEDSKTFDWASMLRDYLSKHPDVCHPQGAAMNSPSGAAERDLHAAIMNLPCKPYDGTDAYKHYARGHRDARHAAAELAAAASAGRDELVEALEEVSYQLSADGDSGEPAFMSRVRAALAKHKGV